MPLAALHRAKAVMTTVLLAAIITWFAAASANAQDDITCAEPTLSGVKANTTLSVVEVDHSYPHLTATTDYEIPLTWPGVAALLGHPGDEKYDAALRCFIAQWPSEQIAIVGEYRQQPPAVTVLEATPDANGRGGAAPARIVLHDEVIGDLANQAAPPLLGPWEVEMESGHLKFHLIPNGHAQYRPLAGTVNLVRSSVAGMIGGLISVGGGGWVDGRRGVVVQGVPVPGGGH